jgi:hypothetical protein
MLVHHVDHPVAEGPQEKEGADQQEDGGVVPPVRGPKKMRAFQEKRISATLVPDKQKYFFVCVNFWPKDPFVFIIPTSLLSQ